MKSFSVFLENGADPNLCEENCKSPLIIAIERKGSDDIIEDRKGSDDLIEVLLERGANVNHRGPSKVTALHVALEQGYSRFSSFISISFALSEKIFSIYQYIGHYSNDYFKTVYLLHST